MSYKNAVANVITKLQTYHDIDINLIRKIYNYFENSWVIRNGKIQNKNFYEQFDKLGFCFLHQHRINMYILDKNKCLIRIENESTFKYNPTSYIISPSGKMYYDNYKSDIRSFNRNLVLNTNFSYFGKTKDDKLIYLKNNKEYNWHHRISNTNYYAVNEITLENIITGERKTMTRPNLKFYYQFQNNEINKNRFTFSLDGECIVCYDEQSNKKFLWNFIKNRYLDMNKSICLQNIFNSCYTTNRMDSVTIISDTKMMTHALDMNNHCKYLYKVYLDFSPGEIPIETKFEWEQKPIVVVSGHYTKNLDNYIFCHDDNLFVFNLAKKLFIKKIPIYPKQFILLVTDCNKVFLSNKYTDKVIQTSDNLLDFINLNEYPNLI